MKGLFTPAFFKFLLGFSVIILLSVVIISVFGAPSA